MNKQLNISVHPGEYLRDEIEARGWTQSDFAEILGRSAKSLSQIISGKSGITARTAKEIATALGTTAELWLNLQTRYDLAVSEKVTSDIDARSKLYSRFPIREMRKRRWISSSKDPSVNESDLREFFCVDELEDLNFAFAAKKSKPEEAFDYSHFAWVQQAIRLSESCAVSTFSPTKITKHLDKLLALTSHTKELRKVPEVLGLMGIRFVIVKQIQGTKIDGGAIWIDKKNPLIALSLRYDRIDNFWHVLLHELSHILNGDANVIDVDVLNVPADNETELRANAQASNWLIEDSVFNSFYSRNFPKFQKTRVIQFANLHQIHPGIVVGKLHYRMGDFRILRGLLTPVRDVVLGTSISDGWD